MYMCAQIVNFFPHVESDGRELEVTHCFPTMERRIALLILSLFLFRRLYNPHVVKEAKMFFGEAFMALSQNYSILLFLNSDDV
jgi:hypothetical protein